MTDTISIVHPKDFATHALNTIDYAHHEIHAGSSYHVNDVINVNTTTQSWLITTPNTTSWAHMIFEVVCTGEASVVITEGGDRVGTTGLSEINRDRNSDNTAGLVVHRDISGGSTDGPLVIFRHRSGSTGVASKTIAVGASRDTNEFILKQNTKYLIVAETFADEHVTLHLSWYEHENNG
ncbi:MAG: hypothetical protein KAS32_21785 [Candidatus Peribacteraceae bacterium]|nr:hypothetical protein [Candidatus Peribacteraceae bacterium]